MSAREKLNIAYFVGALVVAAMIGGLTGSTGIFGLALVVFIFLAINAGDIRPPR